MNQSGLRKCLVIMMIAVISAGCTEHSEVVTPEVANMRTDLIADARKMMPDSSWVVLFRRDRVDDANQEAVAITNAVGGDVRRVFYNGSGFSATLPPEAVSALERNPNVRVVAPNSYIGTFGHSQQPDAPWSLDRIDVRQLAQMDSTYSHTADGSGVNIYIVDTGVNDHSEITGRRIAHNVLGSDPVDCTAGAGHGTPVASVAAGNTLGVARGATVRVFNPICGAMPGDSTQIDLAIDVLGWIEQNHGQHSGPGVVNISWGDVYLPGGGSSGGEGDCPPEEHCSPYGSGYLPQTNAALDSAVVDLVDSGITVVAAAGNAVQDACAGSPGHLPEVITVGGTDESDDHFFITSGFGSNYGSCIDIFAPGQAVPAAHKDGGTVLATGTSFAAPLVTGVVALYLEENPGWSPADVKHWITWRASHVSVGGTGSGSPDRMLFSLVPLTSTWDPPLVTGPGLYEWEAEPEGGLNEYAYEWSWRWVYGDGHTDPWQTLGAQPTQELDLQGWEPEFDLRVVVTSGLQADTVQERVSGHCDPCVEFAGADHES